MKRAIGILARVVFAVSVLLLAAAAVAPFIPAGHLREPVAEALGNALERRIEIDGPIRWKVWGGLGLSAGGVVIHDAESRSLEPLAYVESLDIGLSLRSLWQRRLVFSYLRLVSPSVNLVKTTGGGWSFPRLLDRAFAESAEQGAPLPEIQIRSGRLNFKFGDTKSVFYFSNTDVDIWPDAAEPDALLLRFEGEPSRTDRAAQGFGSFSGGGRVYLPADGENQLDLNLRMERSAIGDVLTLVAGSSFGVEGFLASTARVTGPISQLQIDGELQLAEFDRRYLISTEAREPLLAYSGVLDIPAQTLEMETASGESAGLPLSVRLAVSNYLVRPDWDMTMTLDRFPLATVPLVAKEMGFDPPDGVEWSGDVTGQMSWSSRKGFLGEMRVEDATLSAGGVPLHLGEASVMMGSNRVRIAPADVEIGNSGSARVEAVYDGISDSVEVTVDASSVALAQMDALWTPLTGTEEPPLMEQATGGRFAGRLSVARTARQPARWNGEVRIEDTSISIEGIAKPVEIGAARVAFGGGGARVLDLDASVAGIPFSGSYEWTPDDDRPHRVDLEIPELDASALESVLAPVIHRSRPGFLARTLRLAPTQPPKWLSDRHAAGHVRIGTLTAGDRHIEEVGADLYWDGTYAQFVNLTAHSGAARLDGRLSVDLQQPVPTYRLRAVVKGAEWDDAAVSGEGRLQTRGTGAAELIANATGEGAFHAKRSGAAPGEGWRTVDGCYELAPGRPLPQVRLSCLTVDHGASQLHGRGSLTADGSFALDLFAGDQIYKGSATLEPLSMEVAPVSAE